MTNTQADTLALLRKFKDPGARWIGNGFMVHGVWRSDTEARDDVNRVIRNRARRVAMVVAR